MAAILTWYIFHHHDTEPSKASSHHALLGGPISYIYLLSYIYTHLYAHLSIHYPAMRCSQDSDLWAIYTRQCLGQVLDMSSKAAMVVDPDIESLMPKHTQHARPAPRRR